MVIKNEIEGISTSDSRFIKIVTKDIEITNRNEAEILGYKDVLSLINNRYEEIDLSENNILFFHKLLYDRLDFKSSGYKKVQNYITITKDGKAETRFIPTSPFETKLLIKKIVSSYQKAVAAGAIPLILIPLFILDFLSIHPFEDGNGRISRLLTHLLLLKSNFNIAKYISLEAIINESKLTYYEVLKKGSINWHEGKNDASDFVKYFLSIILKAYQDLDLKLEISTNDQLSALEKVIEVVNKLEGSFKKKDILKLLPTLSLSSIEKALNKLVSNKLITKKGQGKNTFYTK